MKKELSVESTVDIMVGAWNYWRGDNLSDKELDFLGVVLTEAMNKIIEGRIPELTAPTTGIYLIKKASDGFDLKNRPHPEAYKMIKVLPNGVRIKNWYINVPNLPDFIQDIEQRCIVDFDEFGYASIEIFDDHK